MLSKVAVAGECYKHGGDMNDIVEPKTDFFQHSAFWRNLWLCWSVLPILSRPFAPFLLLLSSLKALVASDSGTMVGSLRGIFISSEHPCFLKRCSLHRCCLKFSCRKKKNRISLAARSESLQILSKEIEKEASRNSSSGYSMNNIYVYVRITQSFSFMMSSTFH